MTSTYATLPNKPSIKVEPYTVSIPDQEIEDLKAILKHTRIPKETFENNGTHADDYGVTRGWFIEARDAWLQFDCRKVESRINAQANYLAEVDTGAGHSQTIHFMALFSQRPEAIPIVFCNGWPSCFLEYLPLFEYVSSQHSPEDLPYHLIVPSLPGFAFSSKPPVDKDFGYPELIQCYAALMKGLGFKDYIAQGSDIGGGVIDGLASMDPACRAIHANNRYIQAPPEGTPEYEKMQNSTPGPGEMMKKILPFGYAIEQGTKPATAGLSIGCSPMSLLAWNGEKIKALSHPELDMDTILAFTSLWWFTDTYPSSIYIYRQMFGPKADPKPQPKPKKPLGYSYLPHDLGSAPIHWVEKEYNLVWSKTHKDGGHFPFLEHPVESWENLEEYVKVIQKMK